MNQRSARPSTRTSDRSMGQQYAGGGSPRGRGRGPARSGRGQGGQSRPRTGAAGGEFALPTGTSPLLPPAESFAELSMPAPLLTALGREGVTAPFPIQAATLPDALNGRDVLGRGRTGSGKTLAFGLALLSRTHQQRAESGRPLVLVLVPTRELAQQVTDALTPYAHAVGLRMATVVGGISLTRQAHALRRGAEVLVATPGRLKDLIGRGDCALDQVGITVLDEADQMADMGFMPQVTALLEQVRPGGQRMLFSATLDRNVDKLVRRFLRDPAVHSVDPSAGAVTTMEHHVLHVSEADKNAAALHIGARDGRVIMFMNTKHSVDRMVKRLLSNGVHAGALHGGKTQPQRNRTLEQFKTGHLTALVATNVAARGIHIDDLDLVVNIDPPTDHKDYLHRGGRTARAGKSGRVVTLAIPAQRREVDRLMAAAAITPRITQVRPGDGELTRVTGAREPSGIPVTPVAPTPQRSERSERPERAKRSGASGRGRRSRSAQPGRGSSSRAAGPQRPASRRATPGS